MKIKNILFVGGVVFWGAAIYGAFKLLKLSAPFSKAESPQASGSTPVCKFDNIFPVLHESELNPEKKSEVKQTVADTIVRRHQAVNEFVKKSISSIFIPDEAHSFSSCDDEEFDELNKKLDAMLDKGDKE